MRDATPEEREQVHKYIESISEDTGINFYDLIRREDAIKECDKQYPNLDRQDIKSVINAVPSAICGDWDGDLISRQDAICAIDEWMERNNLPKIGEGILYLISSVDVEPVKQGKWIPKLSSEDKVRRYECSICGYVHIKHPYTVEFFCPSCGADMRGDTE